MPDNTAGTAHHSPATPESRREPTIWDPQVERLDEAECWRLISAGGVGRLAYSGRSGLAVLPVGYQVQEDSLALLRCAILDMARAGSPGSSAGQMVVARSSKATRSRWQAGTSMAMS